jgi:D-arabinose 5-phosphate isomerase GutQ
MPRKIKELMAEHHDANSVVIVEGVPGGGNTMGDQNYERDLSRFLDVAMRELGTVRRTLDCQYYARAVALILEAKRLGKRLHVTGIGKPHHVSNYVASLLSSTGTPCYMLDGTEATHGSSGQVLPGDVVICISYYGNVQEIMATVATLRRNGAKIISVTGFDDSWVATHGDVHLKTFVAEEGDALNKPPRTSILAIMLVLMGLSVILQTEARLDHEQYVRWHPGGHLGKFDQDSEG